MPVIAETQLLEQLRWRYATKSFDVDKKIPQSTWLTFQETLRLTPSSYGLQPWKFVVIEDAAVRNQLKPASWNQSQITEASHLIVFAVKKKIGEHDIDEFLSHVAATHGVEVSSLAQFRAMMVGDVVKGPRAASAEEWATRQAYIALGNAMTSAALLGIDSCPIEGFDPAQYDQILKLGERGLASKVVLALGYRASHDKSAQRPKVRFALKDLFIHI